MCARASPGVFDGCALLALAMQCVNLSSTHDVCVCVCVGGCVRVPASMGCMALRSLVDSVNEPSHSLQVVSTTHFTSATGFIS